MTLVHFCCPAFVGIAIGYVLVVSWGHPKVNPIMIFFSAGDRHPIGELDSLTARKLDEPHVILLEHMVTKAVLPRNLVHAGLGGGGLIATGVEDHRVLGPPNHLGLVVDAGGETLAVIDNRRRSLRAVPGHSFLFLGAFPVSLYAFKNTKQGEGFEPNKIFFLVSPEESSTGRKLAP